LGFLRRHDPWADSIAGVTPEPSSTPPVPTSKQSRCRPSTHILGVFGAGNDANNIIKVDRSHAKMVTDVEFQLKPLSFASHLFNNFILVLMSLISGTVGRLSKLMFIIFFLSYSARMGLVVD
jgi:hypothetical protein